MICVILAADLNFEVDHKNIVEKFGSTRIPTSLLSGIRYEDVLQSWWQPQKQKQIFSDVFLVTNALLYKFYEQWAMCNDLPVANIINNGMSVQRSKPGLGGVADLDLVLRTKRIDEDILVVPGEVLVHQDECDIMEIVQQFEKRKHFNIGVCYKAADDDSDEGARVDHQFKRLAHHPSRLINFRDGANGCVVISTLHTNIDQDRQADLRKRSQNMTWHNNKPAEGVLQEASMWQRMATGNSLMSSVQSAEHDDEQGITTDSWLDEYAPVKSGGEAEESSELTDESSASETSVEIAEFQIDKADSESNDEMIDEISTDKWDMKVLFYCLGSEVINKLQQFLIEQDQPSHHTFSYFMEWVVNLKKENIYGMHLPQGCHYLEVEKTLGSQAVYNEIAPIIFGSCGKQAITKRAYARVGLVGNPSDGFHGKTISLSIANFWAEVSLVASEQLVLTSDVLNKALVFNNLRDLHRISEKDGYGGGLPLLQATCKKFYSFCKQNGIKLMQQNFTISYKTNIPRQVGLAGSSAIIKATLDCLIDFYALTAKDLPKVDQPQWILEVEKDELNIRAGLQDRVIQVYEGLVYMDFAQELFEKQGHGNYINLQPCELPNFWLSYVADPSDSGKIHNDVASRWRQGDETVVMGMTLLADLTDLGRQAIQNADWKQFSSIMDQNFDLRRKMYGDKILGKDNLRMIDIARSCGSSAKFSGSGGAVVGLCLDSDKMVHMKKAMTNAGYVVCDLIPNFCRMDVQNVTRLQTSV